MGASPAPRDGNGADSIKVLKGLDLVRKLPGTYIGDTDDGYRACHFLEQLINNHWDFEISGLTTETLAHLFTLGGLRVVTSSHSPLRLAASELVTQPRLESADPRQRR